MNPDTTHDIFKAWVEIPTRMHEVRVRVTPREDHTLVEQVAIKLLKVQPLSPSFLADTLLIDDRVCEGILESLRFHGLATFNESTGTYEPCGEDSLESNTEYVSGYLHYSDITGDLLPDVEMVDGEGPGVPGNLLKDSDLRGLPTTVSTARFRDLSMSLQENPGAITFANDGGVDGREIHGLMPVHAASQGSKPGTSYALVHAMPRSIDGKPIITVHRPIPKMGFNEGKHAPHDTIYRERLESNYPVLWKELEEQIDRYTLERQRHLAEDIDPANRERVTLEVNEFIRELQQDLGLDHDLLASLQMEDRVQAVEVIAYKAYLPIQLGEDEFDTWLFRVGKHLIENWMKALQYQTDDYTLAIVGALRENLTRSQWEGKEAHKEARESRARLLAKQIIDGCPPLASRETKLIEAMKTTMKRGKLTASGPTGYLTNWCLGLAHPDSHVRELNIRIHEHFSKYMNRFWGDDYTSDNYLLINMRNKSAHDKSRLTKKELKDLATFRDTLRDRFENIDTPRGRLDLVRWVCERIAASCRAYRDASNEPA